MIYKKKKKQSDFEFLVELKAKMKKFMKTEEEIRQKMDIESDKKKFKLLQKELDNHLLSFKHLEGALVVAEEKMIDLDRGLYKGVGINVQDKELRKIPIYLKFNSFTHIGYTGTTRVGKTKNMINDARQLIAKGWDVIIVDPKGGEDQEILTEVMQSCLKCKRAEDFKYISPAFPRESEYINVLYGMEDDEVASLMKTFASSQGEGGDEFFSDIVFENTLAVTKGLKFIEAATDPFGKYTQLLEEKEYKKYEKLKNLKNVNTHSSRSRWDKTNNPNELSLITENEIIENDYSDEQETSSVSFYENRSMLTFKTLDAYTTHKSLSFLKARIEHAIPIPPIEQIGKEKFLEIQGYKQEALSILDKVLAIDETHFQKISKSHSVLLSQLVYGDIGKVFNGTRINPLANRILSENKGLVSVIQPFPMKYKAISNKTIMAILKMIESLMGLVGSSGRGIKRKLVIMIDEAGAVLYKGIEELFNKAGGLNTNLFVYTQSYEDYKLSVGETNANVIMDNVNTPITMRMNNDASCERASKSLGTVREHKSMYMSEEAGGRFSVGSEDVPVALTEDISNLAVGTGYMRHNGETYIIDFPYIKGLDDSPIKMPVLDNERIRREMANQEISA